MKKRQHVRILLRILTAPINHIGANHIINPSSNPTTHVNSFNLPLILLDNSQTDSIPVLLLSDVLKEKSNRPFDIAAPQIHPLTDVTPTTHLTPFLTTWKMTTSNAWVLNILPFGYAIEFSSTPPTAPLLRTPSSPTLRQEITSLLQKDAIEELPFHLADPRFYSHYFIVPPKDGSLQPILDLRRLNSFIDPHRFRMASLDTIIPLLQQDDWFITIDLRDAYFQITIRDDHRKFLRFAIDDNIYQFKALPFGLSTAPLVFTKCMAPVIAYLRLRGISIFSYLDDWLLPVVAPS